MLPEIVVAGSFFLGELFWITGVAAGEFAVPSNIAGVAKGKGAFAADLEATRAGRGGLGSRSRRWSTRRLFDLRVGIIGEVVWNRWAIVAPRRSLAPLSRTVNGCLVAFNPLFALHLDIPASGGFSDADLQQFSRMQ